MKQKNISNLELSLQETLRTWVDLDVKSIKQELSEQISCPSCQSKHRKKHFMKDCFHYDLCLACQLVYMNPRIKTKFMKDFYNSPTNEIYNQDKFGLQTESLLVDDQINTEILKTSLQTIGRKIQGEKFLEIGPGRGVLLKVAQDLGFKVYGNELNDALSESLISQFGDAIEACEVQESCYPDNHFDVIYLRDVIEHITDPRFFLDELNRILKIDGSLVICTHNIHGLIHKMVGKRHPVVFGFEHPIHWSPASLRNGLKNSGFTTEQTLYEWDFKKVQNRLSDFTLNSILAYWLIPSFSSIQPFNKKLRISRALLYRLLTNRIFGLQNPVLSRIERAIGHGLCRATRRPSYFVVIAKKITR